jgi:hypothetical protein
LEPVVAPACFATACPAVGAVDSGPLARLSVIHVRRHDAFQIKALARFQCNVARFLLFGCFHQLLELRMIRSMVTKSRRALALSAVAAMSLCGPAKAAEFVVNWDPIFSTSVTALVGFQLGWKGTASVTVDATCLAAPGVVVVGTLACPTATLNSFVLEFYNTNPVNVIATYTAGTPATITDVSVDINNLVNGINLAGTGIDISLDPFTLGAMTFEDMDLDFTIAPFLGPVLSLYDNGTETTYSSTDTDATPPKVTWIPEPTPLVLVGAALVALGLNRRRKA